MTTEIGPWKVGERPFPHVVAFTDNAGQPINITGMTAKWIYSVDNGAPVQRAASVTNGPAGEATYTWVNEDFTVPGIYRAEMWVGSAAGIKLASVTFAFRVRAAVGVPTFA